MLLSKCVWEPDPDSPGMYRCTGHAAGCRQRTASRDSMRIPCRAGAGTATPGEVKRIIRAESPAKPREKPDRPTELPRCVHRSIEPVGAVECQLCGGRTKMEPVYQCELYGRVTERKVKAGGKDRLPDCLSCRDREPAI